jgi:glycosyl-4,4'-diaponeurosporenoate acyltransferase
VTGWIAVAVYSAAWAGFGVASGAALDRVPESRLRNDRGVLRLRPFEHGGVWYRRRLGIARWKDRLPEAAGRRGQGPRKATLVSRSQGDLERFAAETRRAELVHWANVLFGASFLLWAGWTVGVVMVVFGVVVHGPFIAVQRYNRARLERALGRPGYELRSAWRHS